MALDTRKEARRLSATPDQEVMRERAVELREWLLHLEDWVETRVAATRALVAQVVDSPGREGVGSARED